MTYWLRQLTSAGCQFDVMMTVELGLSVNSGWRRASVIITFEECGAAMVVSENFCNVMKTSSCWKAACYSVCDYLSMHVG
jgi:hypothetical protein